MLDYISRKSEEHRGLKVMGWRRSRNQRRRKQPEVWKRKKIWEQAGRELVIRIVRHNGLFRVEVVRIRHGVVWWQPVRDTEMECPLALASALHLMGDGDPVRAAYVAAKEHVDDIEDWPNWVQGFPGQMPKVVPPKTKWGLDASHLMDAQAYSLREQYRQAYSPMSKTMAESLIHECNYKDLESRVEARVAATLQSKEEGYIWKPRN